MAMQLLDQLQNQWRRLVLRIQVFLFWRRPDSRAKVLSGFSSIEADSCWQLQQAYQCFDDIEIKKDIFCQAVEERHHAQLFALRAAALASQKSGKISMPRKALAKTFSKDWHWFSFCYIGEKAALQRFSDLAHILPASSPDASVIKRILRDEAGHVHTASEIAKEIGITAEEFFSAVAAARRQRFRDAWMRQGRKVTSYAAQIILTLSYYLIAPFAWYPAQRRLMHPCDKKNRASLNRLQSIKDIP